MNSPWLWLNWNVALSTCCDILPYVLSHTHSSPSFQLFPIDNDWRQYRRHLRYVKAVCHDKQICRRWASSLIHVFLWLSFDYCSTSAFFLWQTCLYWLSFCGYFGIILRLYWLSFCSYIGCHSLAISAVTVMFYLPKHLRYLEILNLLHVPWILTHHFRRNWC